MDLQCNDQISWIKMGESHSQDHEKEMKGHILEIVYTYTHKHTHTHTRIFSYNPSTSSVAVRALVTH